MSAAEMVLRLADLMLIVPVPVNNEKDLQDKIERALQLHVIDYVREHRLSSSDRPDFYLPGSQVVIEIKTQTSRSALLRQIKSYSMYDQVSAIVVVSLRPYDLPKTLSGKPVVGFSLWRKALA